MLARTILTLGSALALGACSTMGGGGEAPPAAASSATSPTVGEDGRAPYASTLSLIHI